MKTIVARFTEMKKAPGEIIEVDGEEVNVNKVEAALKSVGVQLRDTQGQFRDLDDVFLELASKWDSLDVMSQRYVATMAAGSRQQSRFIAMMSNYQRTMELTGYATNSAGASQKQFEKTMDSLESKLNRLHDAWEQYVTGIANQSIIKGVVDLLTSLLETVNKVTDALDPFHTGWSKILAAFLGFKAAKGVVNGVLKGIGTQLGTRKPNQTIVPGGGPTKTGLDEKQGVVDGTKYGKGFWGAFQKMQAQKKDPMGTRPVTNNIKQSKQLTKEAAELKKNSVALKNQGTELTKLEKQYKDYSNTIATANTQGKNSQKIASKSKTAILQQNQALQRQEASLRENLSVESEAYGQSVARTAKLQEQEAALTGKSAALTKDTAEQFANTSSEELNTAAAAANQSATEMETAAKEKEATAEALNTEAITANTIAEEAGNMTRLQAIAGLFSLNSTKRLAAAVSLGLMSAEEAEAIATGGATAAQTAFNAALYACPIMWIIAAIAALIAGLALLVGWLNKIEEDKRETEKARLEGITQATEDATKKAEEAKEAYDNLLESKNTYNKLREELNSLVEGSEAYIKKLEEQKKLVQETIKNNPNLAAYVTYDEKGNPTISSKGWEIEEQRLKRVKLNTELSATYNDVVNAWKNYLKGSNLTGSDLKYIRNGDSYTAKDEFSNTSPGYTAYYSGDSDVGLSEQYLRVITEGLNSGKITITKTSNDSVQLGSYYIEKSFYDKIKKLNVEREDAGNNFWDYISSATGHGSTDRYDITEFDLWEEGDYSDRTVTIDDDSLLTAIQSSDSNLSQLKDSMTYLYQTAALNALEGTYGIDDITKNRMATALAKIEISSGGFLEDVEGFSSDVQDMIEDNDLNELKKQYEDIYGIFNEKELGFDENDKHYEDKIKGYLAGAIAAQNKFGGEIQEAVQKYYTAYQTYGKDFVAALELSSGQIDQFTNKDLTSVLISSETFKNFSKFGALAKDKLQQMLDAIGISTEADIEDAWQQARANLNQKLNKGYSMFGLSFDKILSGQTGTIKALPFNDYTNALKYSELGTNWEEQIVNLSPSIGKKVSVNFDSIFGSLTDSSLFKDAEAAEATYERISKINFSNPVQSAHEIKELTEDSNEDFVKLGNTLKSRTKDLLTLTNQASYLYNSLGEQKEDLFEDGFISTDEINELKKTLPDIQTMLDDNSLSASTLATYFNNINSGMLNIIGTSSNFISALDKINKAENTISDSMDFVANFEASESQQTITDSFSEWRESMEQSLERGQYGDQNLQDYAKAILGLDNWNKYYDEFEGNLQEIEELAFEKISLWGDNFYNLWKDFSSKSNLVSLGGEGEINFDLSKITSVEDIIKALMDTYGWSEDIAKAAVADAQTYSSNFSEALNKLSINDSVAELLRGSTQIQDQDDGLYEIFINRDELQILADEAGIDINELITKIKDNIDDSHKITVEDLINEDGTMSDSLEASLTEQITNSIQSAIKGIDNNGGIGTINIGSYLEQLIAAGMDEDKAKEAITRIINQQLMANQKNTKGKKYGFDIKDGKLSIAIGFDSKKSAQEALNVTEYSDSLDDAFTKAGVSAWDSPEVAAARARAMADAASQMTAAIAAGMYIGNNIGRGKGIDTTTFNTIMTQSAEFSKMMDGWATTQEQLAQDATKAGEVTLNTMYTLDGLISAYTTQTSQDGWTGKDDGGSNSNSDWTNDYDQYYNTLKKIEGLERKRTELEKQQSRLTKQRYLDEEKIKANKKAQVDLLKQQARINSDLADTAAAYLRGDSNGDVWFDEATGTIQTNPNAAYYNEEQMEVFNKQLKMMEGYYDQMKSAKDNLADIYEQIEDLTEVISELTDPTYNFDRIVEVLDNTLKNLEREITHLERTDSGATAQEFRRRYEQSAQTYVDKYNQDTNKKAIQEQQLNSLIYSDYSKYFTVDWATKQLTRTATYAGITDPEMQKSVDTIISQAQELCNGIIELDDDQKDIEDSLYDLKKNLADKALEFQEKVYEAVVHAREQAIENLKNIDTSINNAASELISSIQKNIQKIRQDRNNKKTEEELSKMQSRLDFLRMDTSSGNQKTILDLEKQLEDKEQSYTDSLIDQKISELQDQNTEAEKQRKRQIEIMETQLELSKENGAIWKAVDSAIKTGFNSSGRIQKGSDLYNMLSSLDEVTKKNSVQFERWFGELNNLAAAYNANLTADLDTSGQMSNTVSNANDVYGENSEYIKSLKSRLEAMNRDGNFNHLMWYDQEGQKMVYKYSHYYASSQTEADAYNKKVAEYQALARELANARAFYKTNKNASFVSAFNRLYGYDTGGLADYTGLAWLDGTPTSPEMVLSSKDTENFIQLKDILSNVMNGETGKNNNTNGDYYFEIAINVDKVTSDYDVDQIADRIKQQISDSARYRNVNVINLLR